MRYDWAMAASSAASARSEAFQPLFTGGLAVLLRLAMVKTLVHIAVLVDAAFGGWSTVSWFPVLMVAVPGLIWVVITSRSRGESASATPS